MIVEGRGQVDVLDFAGRMHNWMTLGFQELGDTRMSIHYLFCSICVSDVYSRSFHGLNFCVRSI